MNISVNFQNITTFLELDPDNVKIMERVNNKREMILDVKKENCV